MSKVKNAIQDTEITSIKDSIKILNDHSSEVAKCMTVIKIDISSVKTDIEWLKKSYFIIYAASVGALITGLINLLLK